MKYMVGNWKMNQSKIEIENFFKSIDIPAQKNYQAWIAPQALHLSLCQALTSEIKIGAQNCHEKDYGAFRTIEKNLGEQTTLNTVTLGLSIVL